MGACGLLGEFDERLALVLREAKRYGCLNFIDPVVPYKRRWDFLIHALKWTDILHCNNIEASSMTGEEDPHKAANDLIKEGAKLVIVSMSERGVIARTEGYALEMPAFKVPAVDPSGAGDAFCAGMIYKLTETMCRGPLDISVFAVEDVVEILLEGAAAGAACVTAVGTTTAVTRDNVDRLLKEQGSKILKRASVFKI